MVYEKPSDLKKLVRKKIENSQIRGLKLEKQSFFLWYYLNNVPCMMNVQSKPPLRHKK